MLQDNKGNGVVWSFFVYDINRSTSRPGKLPAVYTRSLANDRSGTKISYPSRVVVSDVPK